VENSIEVPQNIKNTTPGYISKGNKFSISKRHLHSMLIAALSTVAKQWKQVRCSSMGKWIKKMWYICTQNAVLPEKDGILSFVTTWMNMQDIILSGIKQA
jgi:hypothetical protein